jgi:hypothetical protein
MERDELTTWLANPSDNLPIPRSKPRGADGGVPASKHQTALRHGVAPMCQEGLTGECQSVEEMQSQPSNKSFQYPVRLPGSSLANLRARRCKSSLVGYAIAGLKDRMVMSRIAPQFALSRLSKRAGAAHPQ